MILTCHWRKNIRLSSVIGARLIANLFWRWLAVGSTFIFCSSLASAGVRDLYDINIPAQSADLALIEFAEQTDQTLIFSFVDTKDVKVMSVSGLLSSHDALTRMLKTTGLSFSITKGGVYTIKILREAEEMKNKSTIRLIAAVVAASALNHSYATELDEIIVTAQKRAESINDIGLSVTAISGEVMDSLGLDYATDIAGHTPGLTAQNANSNGTPLFAIRGMGLDDYHVNNNSSVGLYIDNVYISSPIFMHGLMYDMERVEVLKGPQGTLYGKNAAGGVINYIHKKPTEEHEGYLTAGVARWDTINVKGAVSGSFSDRVRGRAAFSHNSGGDWQKDLDNGKEFGETKQTGLRGMLDVDISDRLTTTISAYYSNEDGTPTSNQVEGTEIVTDFLAGILPDSLDLNGAPIGGLLDTGSDDPRDVRVGALKVDRHDDAFGVSVQWTLNADNYTVNSITAWDRAEHFLSENSDGSPGPNFDTVGQDVEATQFYQELRISSTFSDNVDWIAGLTYSSDEIDASVNQDFSMISMIQSTVFDSGLFTADSVYLQESNSFGVYFNTDVAVTDKLNLIAGIRYSSDERSFVGTGTNIYGGFSFVADSEDDEHDETDISYRVALEYHLDDDWLLYSSVATGYKNGVFFAGPPLSDASWSYVEPEEVFGYEFGFKAKLLNNSLNLNAALFHYDMDDRQAFVLFVIPPGLLEVGLDSIPKAEIDGAEMELKWQPIIGLNLNLGIAYLDAKVTETIEDVRGFPLAAPIAVGETLSLSPEWSYNALINYTTPVTDEYQVSVLLDYTYRNQVSGILSDLNAVTGTRSNVGARFTLSPADEKWAISLWGRNLTNENDVVRSGTDFYGGRSMIRQLPKTYGIEVKLNFF